MKATTMTVLLFNPRKQVDAYRGARPFPASGQFHPNRAAFEFYPTPPEATRALLAAERFEGSIWEPACGTGWIAKELKAKGHDVVATDLVDYGYGQADRDFLVERVPLARNIITNPPYGRGLADAFCKHAIALTSETGGKVAMLVAIQSLCHPTRTPFFEQHPPAVIYAVDDCTCYPYGDPKKATRSLLQQRYVWLVWHAGYNGPTLFKWLSTAPYKAQQKRPADGRTILLARAA